MPSHDMRNMYTFGSMHFEGSKNLIEDEMWSKRNSLERMLLGSGGSDILYVQYISFRKQ